MAPSLASAHSFGVPLPLDCPVCTQKIPDGEEFCPGCGYPIAFVALARRVAEEPEPTPAPRPGGSPARAPAPRRIGPAPSRGRDQTAEACAVAARQLVGDLEVLGQLGGAPQGYLGEMRQAALVQAEGKPAESLELLRAAEVRATREVGELFTRRGQELESRAKALGDQGVRAEIAAPLETLRTALAASDRAAAARSVIEADRKLQGLEQDLRGIQGLLSQIELLREGARAAGRPIAEIDADVEQVRGLLARTQIDAETLDTGAQIAARVLMQLNEALPELLEIDLDRSGTSLEAYPSDHPGARRARTLHAEATRNLRRGRLPEAAGRLAELRRTIAELEAPPALGTAPPIAEPPEIPAERPPAVLVAPGGASTPEAEDDALPRLLTKARSLATRVRALAPESELAFEAAAEIRRATELLKSRKLEEADTALTRLMRTLDSEPAPEP